ncbi:nuclear transport factor 2 family protein [Gammaproteobacteria bacterium LSUCC0057]|uniref:Nuclear transport factor 2 family protein n=1 Tax=Gammaproteobacteria bacterium LSUCC0057 TaxID=2559237 RepID=A0A4Y8UK97_9GAMM|nr:nuclear transport factor 2 family protein [Gammaproteobacteria bacterium LSUCC0057]
MREPVDHYRAIEQLIYRYAESIDSGDIDGLARLFERGQVVSLPSGWQVKGYGSLKDFYLKQIIIYPSTGTPCTAHSVTNVIIDLDQSNGTALARSQFVVRQALEGEHEQVVMSGRYSDQFSCDDNGWYFTQRKILPTYFGDLSRHFRGQLDRTPAGQIAAPDNVVAFAGDKRLN